MSRAQKKQVTTGFETHSTYADLIQSYCREADSHNLKLKQSF